MHINNRQQKTSLAYNSNHLLDNGLHQRKDKPTNLFEIGLHKLSP